MRFPIYFIFLKVQVRIVLAPDDRLFPNFIKMAWWLCSPKSSNQSLCQNWTLKKHCGWGSPGHLLTSIRFISKFFFRNEYIKHFQAKFWLFETLISWECKNFSMSVAFFESFLDNNNIFTCKNYCRKPWYHSCHVQ